MDIFAHLDRVIAQRRTAAPDTSYVASLNARGLPVIARKLGEEGVEAAVALLSGSDEDLVGEAADVVFHLAVALHSRGLSLADLAAELERREGTSGLVEKAGRT
jgi:phosphoribosyl-ATP pyrophosphohydrolase